MTAVRTWTGREAAALRAALRLSIRDFAELLGVGVRTVTKWQSRGRDMCLRPATQALLDTALRRATDEQQARFALLADTPQASSSDRTLNSSAPQGADLDGLPGKPPSLPAVWDSHQNERLVSFLAGPGAGIDRLEPDSALRLSHEWRIADPPQLTHLRSGRHIGKRLACLVIERTDALRRMDDFLGGEDLHRLVRRELDVTVAMMREASYTESTGQQLLGAVGELCQLAGWVASDAGMTDLAERYYLGGVAAAHAAGNRPLAANLLSSLSYQMANVGDPGEAALLASTAYHGAQAEATATTRALLLERLAWANARLGDAEATARSLDAVNDAFASGDPDNDPVWVYWLSRDEIDIMAGRCYAELHQPAPAIELLTTTIDRYDKRFTREVALYLSWLAQAHLDNADVEAAAQTALRALRLSSEVASARSRDRIDHIAHLLDPHRGNRTVDDLQEKITTVALTIEPRGN